MLLIAVVLAPLLSDGKPGFWLNLTPTDHYPWLIQLH